MISMVSLHSYLIYLDRVLYTAVLVPVGRKRFFFFSSPHISLQRRGSHVAFWSPIDANLSHSHFREE